MPEYIERDMFLKIISHKPSSPTTDREDRLINYCISAVKNFPAADVRPVERRKDCRNLLDYESLFECSNCGWTSSDTYTADPMKYCPGCGARIVKQEVPDD